MSFNLVSPICLGQWRAGEITVLPKHTVEEIHHPKISARRGGGSHFGRFLQALLWSRAADWQATLAWSCSKRRRAPLVFIVSRLRLMIESVALEMKSRVKSPLSSLTVIYSPSSGSVWTASVIAAISVWTRGCSYFGCSHLSRGPPLMEAHLWICRWVPDESKSLFI